MPPDPSGDADPETKSFEAALDPETADIAALPWFPDRVQPGVTEVPAGRRASPHSGQAHASVASVDHDLPAAASPERPSLTLSEAAGQCGVSRSTIRRKHESGAFPSAFKDGEGAWRVPVTDLIAAGLTPGRPSPPDQVSEASEQARAATRHRAGERVDRAH